MIFLKENTLTMIVDISLLLLGITGILNTFAQTETNNTQTIYNKDKSKTNRISCNPWIQRFAYRIY